MSSPGQPGGGAGYTGGSAGSAPHAPQGATSPALAARTSGMTPYVTRMIEW
ncbi:Uncharacterised protein [Mycobacteroides abscessus]|nr:Uncharacterised protein [Mycobacteroides abscessus]